MGGVGSADWMSSPQDASPGRPHFAVGNARGEPPPVPVSPAWELLGFGSGHSEDLDDLPVDDPPSPAAFSDQIEAAAGSCTRHSSMARDGCMPTDVSSAISATSPDEAYLFEPYLLRLCHACDLPGCAGAPEEAPALSPFGIATLAMLLLAIGLAWPHFRGH
jgi:hypothetical protein